MMKSMELYLQKIPFGSIEGLSAVVITGSSDIYFGISKARPDLKEALDAAMRAIEYDKPFYNVDLYKQYISTETVVFLVEKEKSG